MIALRTLTRWQAAGIHLALSVLVAAAVLAALLLVWYPQPYFRLAGGAGLMMILIGGRRPGVEFAFVGIPDGSSR